jgi:hypothetical protein
MQQQRGDAEGCERCWGREGRGDVEIRRRFCGAFGAELFRGLSRRLRWVED